MPEDRSHPAVLVVEDDGKLAQLLCRWLEHGGFVAHLARTGDEALWAMTRIEPAAVVLDVMIPHPDGIEVCRHLRRSGWTRPVILISARNGPADRARAEEAGSDAFIAKPFPLKKLTESLDELLARRSWGMPS